MLRIRPSALLPFLFAPLLLGQQPMRSPIADDLAERIRVEGIEHSQAMRLLRDLTGKVGHRLTGSDNLTQAGAWAAAEFQAMGLPLVTLEKWAEWKLAWNRGVWRGRLLSPIDLDLYVATEAWTAGTDGPQVGVIVKVPEEVADITHKTVGGKWLYFTKRPGKEVREACAAAGMLGWVYRAGDPDKTFPNRVRVFGDHRTAMRSLAEVPTLPEIAVRADQADQIAALLDENKVVTANFEIDNRFRDGGIPLYNVIAEIPGSERPDEVVIVCGHLDSWHQAQGTTDNGTGATSTMEVARILMAVGAKPKRTIRFCLWGGEEQGLLGSVGYVQRHRTEMERVSAVFNHDTGTNWAQSLSVTGAQHEQLAPVFAIVARLLTPPERGYDGDVFSLHKVDSIGGGMGGSDHASFLAAGVPAWSWSLKGRSNYFQHTWHTQWDTIDVAVEAYQRHTATVVALAALGTANLEAMLDRRNINTGRSSGQSTAFAAAWFEAELDGFKFTSVKAEGRAARLGVQKGDLLIKVDGRAVESLRQIFQFARETEGESVKFTFRRGEQTFDAALKKDDLPQRRGS